MVQHRNKTHGTGCPVPRSVPNGPRHYRCQPFERTLPMEISQSPHPAATPPPVIRIPVLPRSSAEAGFQPRAFNSRSHAQCGVHFAKREKIPVPTAQIQRLPLRFTPIQWDTEPNGTRTSCNKCRPGWPAPLRPRSRFVRTVGCKARGQIEPFLKRPCKQVPFFHADEMIASPVRDPMTKLFWPPAARAFLPTHVGQAHVRPWQPLHAETGPRFWGRQS